MDLYSEMVNIAKIRDGLFIGDIVAGTTLDIVLEFKISHMINTCSSQVPSQFNSIGVKYLNLAWPEHPSLNLPLIRDELVTKIVNFIDGCLRNGDGLMIYSYKGQNRCCAVILIYLMKKYFWSLQKCKEYLLSKKQDMKLSKNFLEHLNNYENHLNKMYPNRVKSTTWITSNLKDGEELLMANTYINEVEIKKKKINFEQKIKNNNVHIGWADDKNNEKNKGSDAKLINYNLEDDLIINKSNEKEKVIFFDTKELLIDNNVKKEKEEEKEEKEGENNENLNPNKESMSEFNISNNVESSYKKQNNKIKLNILKNMPQKDLKEQMIYNTGGEEPKLKLDVTIKEFSKKNKQNQNINKMNINFNDVNIQNFHQKYINNFLENNEPNFKSGNNYPIYLKNKGGNKRARSSSKNSNNNNNNNIIPFIEYNPNNNIITNFMLNQNNNQKLFVKFNKDIQRGRSDNNNIINNNNQFIQNNNFININYYPQPNEGKYIYYIYINFNNVIIL